MPFLFADLNSPGGASAPVNIQPKLTVSPSLYLSAATFVWIKQSQSEITHTFMFVVMAMVCLCETLTVHVT